MVVTFTDDFTNGYRFGLVWYGMFSDQFRFVVDFEQLGLANFVSEPLALVLWTYRFAFSAFDSLKSLMRRR